MSLKKNISTLLFAVFFVGFVFLLLYYTCGVFYLTNDDVGFMKTYSGYYSGVPSVYNSYGSYTLGSFYVLLYSVLPAINWYTVVSIMVLIISNAIIIFCILNVLDEKIKINFGYFLICGLITVAVNFYGIKRVSWTLNGVFASTAGMMLLLLFVIRKKYKWWFVFISILLFGLGGLIRYGSLESVIPYAVLVVTYYYVSNREKLFFSKKNKCILMNAFLFLILLGLMWCYQYVDSSLKNKVQPVSEEYSEFEFYRSLYSDCYHIPYEGNEEFYESIGWDEEFYNATEQFFYMDERFNAENLKLIAEKTEDSIKGNDKQSSYIDYVVYVFEYIQSDPIIPIFSLSIFFMFLAGTSLFVVKILRHKAWQDWFLVGGAATIALLECAWLLVVRERLIDRTFYCAVIPAVFIGASILFKNFSSVFRSKVLSTTFCVFVVIFAGSVATFWIVDDERQKIRAVSQAADEADLIIANNPDKLFITDDSISYGCNLFLNMELAGRVQNSMLYGGTGIYTESYYRTIAKFGFDEFYSDDFLNDKVLFMTLNPNFSSSEFLTYMRNLYGEDIDVIEIEHSTSGVYVYKFVRLEEA